jgi:transmembrane sensor
MMAKPYSGYTFADFVTDDAFIAWAKGQAPQTEAFWQNLRQQHPEQVGNMEQASLAVRQLATLKASVPVGEAVRHWAGLEPLLQVGRRVVLPQWQRWAAAAALLVAVGTWWAVTRQPLETPTVAQPPKSTQTYSNLVAKAEQQSPARCWQETTNPNPTPLLVNLPDGSSVLLAPSSRIRYELTIHPDRREVFLDGEGFFEVAKNTQRPFFVYANELVTKVTGTSFRVRAYAHESRVTVRVKTGRVTLLAQADAAQARPLLVSPNQEASLVRQTGRFSEKTALLPALLPDEIEGQMFVFEFTPVIEVLTLLENTYGVTIEYDREVLADCTIKATLGDEPFLDKIKLVCLATEASYEQADGKIVIKKNRKCRE